MNKYASSFRKNNSNSNSNSTNSFIESNCNFPPLSEKQQLPSTSSLNFRSLFDKAKEEQEQEQEQEQKQQQEQEHEHEQEEEQTVLVLMRKEKAVLNKETDKTNV
jgi:hypothetical protein